MVIIHPPARRFVECYLIDQTFCLPLARIGDVHVATTCHGVRSDKVCYLLRGNSTAAVFDSC
jgi:hypothetical protein